MKKWPQFKTDLLIQRVNEGKHAGEIADELDMPVRRVYAKGNHLGIHVRLDPTIPRQLPPVPKSRFAPERFPTFENISKAESKEIYPNAPKSAQPKREEVRSLTGNAALYCMTA